MSLFPISSAANHVNQFQWVFPLLFFFNTEHPRRDRVAQFIRVECKKRVKADENFVVKSCGWRESRNVEYARQHSVLWVSPSVVDRAVSASPRGLIFYFLTVSLARSLQWKISVRLFKHSRCTISDTDRTIAIFGNIWPIFGRSFQVTKLQFPHPRKSSSIVLLEREYFTRDVQVCLYFSQNSEIIYTFNFFSLYSDNFICPKTLIATRNKNSRKCFITIPSLKSKIAVSQDINQHVHI